MQRAASLIVLMLVACRAAPAQVVDAPTQTPYVIVVTATVLPTDGPGLDNHLDATTPTATIAPTLAQEPTVTPMSSPTPEPTLRIEPTATTVPTINPTATLNPALGAAAYVVRDGNVRNRPTTEGSTILDQVRPGEVVRLRMRTATNQWYAVMNPRNVIGWVHHTIVTVDPALHEMILVGVSDPAIPEDRPTEVAVVPTSVQAVVNEGETGDDVAYKQHLRATFGMLGDHRLQFDDVTISHLALADTMSHHVSFEVALSEVNYLLFTAKRQDLQRWAESLLEELKQRWPGAQVHGQLAWTHYSREFYSSDSDCHYQGETYVSGRGWYTSTYFATIYSAPQLKSEKVEVCTGVP